MRAQDGREDFNTKTNPFTPCKGKRELRSSLRSKRRAFWLKAFGIALFFACPYIYHAFMKPFSGHPAEGLLLIIVPVLIFYTAFAIYAKGVRLDAD